MFAFDSILLVGEFQACVFDALDDVRVIQRCCGRVVDSAVNGEVDVSVAEGLGACIRVFRVGVFGRSEEPEEGNDDEVNDVLVEGSILGMVPVQDVVELSQYGDVGWVGTAGRIVCVSEGFEESRE